MCLKNGPVDPYRRPFPALLERQPARASQPAGRLSIRSFAVRNRRRSFTVRDYASSSPCTARDVTLPRTRLLARSRRVSTHIESRENFSCTRFQPNNNILIMSILPDGSSISPGELMVFERSFTTTSRRRVHVRQSTARAAITGFISSKCYNARGEIFSPK